MRILAALLIAAALLLGPAPQPAQALACGKTYIVEPGDTLYSIADECDISYLVLIGINYEIRDSAKIYPGQVIRLVAEEPLEQAHPRNLGPAQDAGYQPGGTYIVRKGDSLARIAYLYDTTIPELLYYNPQLNGNAIIFAGQVLHLPPTARHNKGWVGVSTLISKRNQNFEVRALDFTPYAILDFQLGVRGEDEAYIYGRAQGKTDAKGELRVTMTIPWYAWKGEIWQVTVYNLDDPEASPVVSPGIEIVY